jgi:hypothetical protein
MQKKRHITLFIIGLCVFTILLSEGGLRAIGYKAGVTSSQVFAFNNVDTIKNYNYFLADKNGLQVANQDCTAFFSTVRLDTMGFLAANIRNGDTVMYVGDSFLWGAGASNPDSNFFNLLANGFNFGIPGADPPQYLKIIETYSSLASVKHIVLCFYMGNDILKEDRPILPYCDAYYETNAGFLLGYYQGKYLSLEESVLNAKNFYLVPKKHFSEKICAQSALLTLLFYTIPQWVDIRRTYDVGDYNLVNSYLIKMQKKANDQNKTFSIFIIPSTNNLEPKTKYAQIFKGVDHVYWPKGLFNKNDFEKTAHFNNSGHRKFAAFIASQFQGLQISSHQ